MKIRSKINVVAGVVSAMFFFMAAPSLSYAEDMCHKATCMCSKIAGCGITYAYDSPYSATAYGYSRIGGICDNVCASKANGHSCSASCKERAN